MEKVARAKTHIQYRLRDKTRVAGVTTFLSVLAKPALKYWANKLGLSGVDVRKYVDELAEAGKLAHQIVADHLRGQRTDTSEHSKVNIDRAENAFLSYLTWEKGKAIEPILIETPLVSEKYRYGGTIDCYCKIDGVLTLLDFKTSKALYPEMSTQVVAYRQLLIEHGHTVETCQILRIGRTEEEGFEIQTVGNIDTHWELFKHCLGIYELQKLIKKGG